MTVAPVPCIGDALQITCTASVARIEWSFTVVNKQGKEEQVSTFSTAETSDNQSVLIQVNSTTFTLIRNSSRNAQPPLIVTLSIDSVSIGLNGTVVTCRDAENSMISASTTIQIIDSSNSE